MKISTITVTGPDAFDLLQGQLSNDLARLESATEILAAWCNPKGRVIWFGTVWAIESGFCLSAPDVSAKSIVQRMTMFRFRSKVEFKIVDDGGAVDAADLIRRGHPYVGPEQSEQFTPHMLNLDLLDAVSFDKGCYTGQEIVARTHFKGATKRRTVRFECDAPVSAGDKVSLAGREIGEVLNASGIDLLAVIPLKNAAEELSVRDSRLRLATLPYLDLKTS